MNIVKFYHRETGSVKRVKVTQKQVGRLTAQENRKHYPVGITERLMAHAGYFRKRPKATA